jgi:hypothetical protein
MLTCACARLRIIMNEGLKVTHGHFFQTTDDREQAERVYWRFKTRKSFLPKMARFGRVL